MACIDPQSIAEGSRRKAAEWINGTSDSIHPAASRHVRPLVLYSRTGGGNSTYEQVNPMPLIGLVSQNEARRFAALEYNHEVDDFSIRGLSREIYTYKQILQIQSYLIDGVLDLITGALIENPLVVPYTRVAITEGGGNTWDLIVRRKTLR